MWFRKKNRGEGGVGTGVSSGQFAAKTQTAPGTGAQLAEAAAPAEHRFGYGPKVASAVKLGDHIDRDGHEWEVIGRHERRGVDAQLRFQVRRTDTASSTHSMKVSHTEMLSVSRSRGTAKQWQADQMKAPMHLSGAPAGESVSTSLAERLTEDAIDHGQASRQAAERALRRSVEARVAVSGLRIGDRIRAPHPVSGIPDQAHVTGAQMHVRDGQAVSSLDLRFTDGSNGAVDSRPYSDTVEVLKLRSEM